MTITPRALPWTRLGVGLVQGLALLVLYQAAEQKTWPATDGLTFASLVTVAVFVPVLVISGLGNLRWRTLAAWAVAATLLCAGLAFYDIYRDPVALAGAAAVPRIMPSEAMWLSLAATLFIVHTLTVAGEADRRWLASYPTHFDVSWKHGVQFVLAVVFVAVFWGLLFLGSELFRLIKIEFLADLIKRKTFAIPVTALAFSYAIQITDARANIVQGARTLLLTLLSWLLPLMASMGAAFVVALLFTGLEPLWATRRAASILLTSAAALVFLINAAHQDGRPENRAVAVLRYAKVLAAVVLVPLVGLAAYALMLRISQYGWTPRRVTALTSVVVTACYGLGYVIAVTRSGVFMTGLETTNLLTSLAIVGLLLALRMPLADPARISAEDQIGRLLAGKVSPEQFDFAFLRLGAGRYGTAALKQLADRSEGHQATFIAERATQALNAKGFLEISQLKQGKWAQRVTPQSRTGNIAVIQSDGATLPDRFLQHDWSTFSRQFMLPRCLVADAKCEAILRDLDGDGQPEILLFNLPSGNGTAFKSSAGGDWEFVGTIANATCPGVREALRAGHFEVIDPSFRDVVANGQRLRIQTECAPAQGKT